MTRQLEVQAEIRETKKRDALVKALEFGLVGSIQGQGLRFLGLAITYNDFSCRMVLKADKEGERVVCFVYSDTMINCFLAADREAYHHTLTWVADKYHPK